MRKLFCIVMGLMFLLVAGCSKGFVSSEEKTAENYVKAQGYKITAHKGEVQKYTLEKDKLCGGTETIPYQQMWAVQKVEPEKYFGKEITIYGFTVKDHPLQDRDSNAKNGVNLYIMLADSKVIGGFSYPNADVCGAYTSLDGKTLEEVTGLTYEQWGENWKKKYGN